MESSLPPRGKSHLKYPGDVTVVLNGVSNKELHMSVVFPAFGIGFQSCIISEYICYAKKSEQTISGKLSPGGQHPVMELSLPPRGKLPTFSDVPCPPWHCPT